MEKKIKELIMKEFARRKDKIEFINDLKIYLSSLSIENINPVDRVLWIKEEKIQANDYNPNNVATRELELLHLSIKNDGYTQPIVTIYDKNTDKFIIVDGFHRYFVLKNYKDIYERNKGYLPVVVIDKDIKDRMASTIRHNRARGQHQITGMSNIVFKMLDEGWSDDVICNQLGMEPDELIRLKHITGFSKLFENVEYKKSWKTKKQLLEEKRYKRDENSK